MIVALTYRAFYNEISKSTNGGMDMFRQCTRLMICSAFVFTVAACSNNVDTKISKGFESADQVFEQKPKTSTASTEHLQFYLPKDFTIKSSSDETNILLKKGDETFSLFINPHEPKQSKQFYKAIQQKEKDAIVKEQTYEKDGQFGFASVLEDDNHNYRVVASTGGVKITGVSGQQNIDHTIPELMEIAHSVQIKNK